MIYSKTTIFIFLSFILIALFIFIFGRRKIIENYPRNKWAECNNACKSYNKVDLANTSTDGTCLYYIDLNTGKCGPKWSHGRDVQSFHAWGKKGYIDCTYCQIENNRGKAPKEREQVCFPHDAGPYKPFLEEEIKNTHTEREWRKEQGHPEEWWPVVPQRPPDDHFPPPGQYIKDSCFGTYPDDSLEYKMKLVRLYNHLNGWFGYMPEDPRLSQRETEIAARKCVEANDWDCPVSKYGAQVPKRIQDILKKKKASEPSETSQVFITPAPLVNDPECAKESSCFDAQNSCQDCCSTGKNAKGENCWTSGFSHERCCNAPEPSSAPASSPAPTPALAVAGGTPSVQPILAPKSKESTPHTLPSAVCPEIAKENIKCWDDNFPCDLCCTNGVNKNGLSCWDDTYTRARCCENKDSESGIPTPTPTPIVVQAPASEQSLLIKGPEKSKCLIGMDVEDGTFDFVEPPHLHYVKTKEDCRNKCNQKSDCTVFAKDTKSDKCWLSKQNPMKVKFKKKDDRIVGLKKCEFTSEADSYPAPGPTPSPSPAVAPILPPIIQPTQTVMTPSTETCAKDLTCFDENYDCKGCCENGIAKDGKDCWDHYYTVDRCCSSVNTLPSPINNPPPITNTPAPNILDKSKYNPLSSPDLTPKQCIPGEGICSLYNRALDTGGNVHKDNPLGLRVTTDTGKCMHYISPYGWCGFTSNYKTNALADCTLCKFKETE